MTGTVSQVAGQVADGIGLSTDGVVPVSSRELFWRARYLRASSGLAHLPFLFWLMADFKPRRIVTVNMGEGVLHFAVCQAVDKLSSDAVARGYGSWGGKGVPPALDTYNDEQYDEFSALEEADAGRAARRHQIGSVDLLVVETPDAQVLGAVQEIWPDRLSDRAVILITGCDSLDDAALDRLDALETAYPFLRLDHGGGMRVVLQGEDAPEWLLRLARAEPSHPALMTVARIFGRLGAMHVNEWTARDKGAWARRLAEQLKKSEEKAAALDEKGRALQARVDEAVADRDARTQDAKRAKEALAEAQSALNDTQKDVSRLRQWIESLKSDLAEARKTAASQAQDQAAREKDLRSRADQAEAQLEAAVTTRDQMSVALRTSQAETAHLQDNAEAMRAEAAALTRDLAEAQARAETSAADGAKAEARAETLAQRIETQDRTIARLQAEALARSAELAGTRAELAGVRGALRAARREVDTVARRDDAAHAVTRGKLAAVSQALANAQRDIRVLTGAMRAMDAGRVAALMRGKTPVQTATTPAASAARGTTPESRSLRALRGTLAVVDKARVTLLQRLAETRAAAQAKAQEQAGTIAELQADATRARADLTAARDQATADVAQALATLAEAEDRSIRRAEALKAAERQIAQLRSQVDAGARDELAALHDTVSRLQTELVRQSDELAEAEQVIERNSGSGVTAADVEDLQLALQRERSTLTELTETLAANEARSAAEMSRLRAETLAKDAELTRATDRVSKLTADVARMKKNAQTRQAELDSLQEHARNLQTAYEEMLASTSWRVTAPMRSLRNSLRRD